MIFPPWSRARSAGETTTASHHQLGGFFAALLPLRRREGKRVGRGLTPSSADGHTTSMGERGRASESVGGDFEEGSWRVATSMGGAERTAQEASGCGRNPLRKTCRAGGGGGKNGRRREGKRGRGGWSEEEPSEAREEAAAREAGRQARGASRRRLRAYRRKKRGHTHRKYFNRFPARHQSGVFSPSPSFHFPGRSRS